MAHNKTEKVSITAEQQRAITALLTTKGVEAAAIQAKLSKSTLYRWMKEPDFAAALSAAEGELIATATRRLLALQDKAIQTLEDVLDDEEAGAWLRVNVARAILDYMLKLRELNSIEQRLAALEVTYASQSN